MSATFSPCRTWRYSLTRETGSGYGTVVFVGLNPSTADEVVDDPTIRRCVRFARDWGYAQLAMVNLYAYRATNPRDLWLASDPVGPENDAFLARWFTKASCIVAAWGANAHEDRLEQFARAHRGWPMYVLGWTKAGQPRHPLYIPASARPTPWLQA